MPRVVAASMSTLPCATDDMDNRSTVGSTGPRSGRELQRGPDGSMEQHWYAFGFDIDPRFRPLLWLWGVRKTARVEVGPLHGLVARFGPVRVQTSLGNIASAELTGPYRWYKAIGIRESWVDHGLTLGSTATGGVCIRFRAPVRGLGRRARHPGLTVTVQDRERLHAVLNRLISHSAP